MRGSLALGIKKLNIFAKRGLSKGPKLPNTYGGVLALGIKKLNIFNKGCQPKPLKLPNTNRGT